MCSGERAFFSRNDVGKPDLYLIPYTKINSKCIKDLNVRPEAIKQLHESTVLLYDPKGRAMKATVNKLDHVKLQ